MTSGSLFRLNRLSASSSVNWRMTSRGVFRMTCMSRFVTTTSMQAARPLRKERIKRERPRLPGGTDQNCRSLSNTKSDFGPFFIGVNANYITFGKAKATGRFLNLLKINGLSWRKAVTLDPPGRLCWDSGSGAAPAARQSVSPPGSVCTGVPGRKMSAGEPGAVGDDQPGGGLECAEAFGRGAQRCRVMAFLRWWPCLGGVAVQRARPRRGPWWSWCRGSRGPWR